MKVKFLSFAVSIMILLTACTSCAGSKAEEQRQVSGTPNFAGAYKEMSTPAFWIDGVENPDEILMTAHQIEKFNKNIVSTEATNCVDLNRYKRSLSKEELLQQLQKYKIPEETRYIGATPLADDYYEKLFVNRNEESVAAQNPVRLGVITQNTELRTWPTADVSYNEIDDIDFDLSCETVLKTGERVAILHESTDRKWLYVQAYSYIGWARTEDVALCTEDEWNTIGKNTDWLTVTGNRIILDVNNVNPKVSRRELTMGTKLILLRDKPDAIDGISTISSYVALLPVRNEKGALELVETRVPQSLDVTVGFLAYTPRNIIEQAFKMLGERYGWSGLWDARDCSNYTMDIYHCFGIELPRNSSHQAAVAGARVDVSNYSDADKQALILRQPVGTLIAFKGHIMLYLGAYKGKPYVIHQPYAFIPAGETEKTVAACVLVSDLAIKRGSGAVFLSEIRTVNALVK
ncbi:MAG: SH3 domain-containing protein [Oscillospiraceae bacterium]